MADHLCSWFNAHPGVCYRRPPEYLPSLNFCVKREVVFGRCGIVWPDGPGRTGEDVLFCQALARHGLKLSFLPGATVFHRDRDTLSGFLRHMFRWGQHAPAVRGAALGLKYGFLFPRSRWKLAFTIPLIVSGYSTLVYLAWVRHRPLAATVAIPQILLGRLAYAAGVWSATGRRAAATAATS
jgi:hypothetical protein